MKKRLLALAMAAAFVAGCGKKEEPVAQPTPAPAPAVAQAPAGPVLDDEKVLNIYNWPDYIPDGMLEAFIAAVRRADAILADSPAS